MQTLGQCSATKQSLKDNDRSWSVGAGMSTSAGAAFMVTKERGGAMRGFKGYI